MNKETLKQRLRYNQLKIWYEKYERILLPATLLWGVIFDSLTFANLDTTLAFILLGVYFIVAGGAIALINAYEAGTVRQDIRVIRYLRLASPLILQFTFGAMLNASFIFYFFSGALGVSWPFILLLVFLMVSNELFRQYYLRRPVQVGVYFFILFTLLSIIIPFAVHTLGAPVFILSGIASLLIIGGYLLLLSRIVPTLISERRRLAVIIGIIFLVLNGLYAAKILPPIPLALRDVEIAHDIARISGAYRLSLEKQSLWERLTQGTVFHKTPSGRVFVYTAIFAPRDLVTTIVHHWQQYDEVQKQWVTRDRLSFKITGGLKTGYRGFSVKSQVEPGRWRVDVEATQGQVLGRVNFKVVAVGENVPLETLMK